MTVWIKGLFFGFVTFARYGVVSTDCAARRCSAGHALAGIAIATVMSLRHWPTTDSHDRRAFAEVCTVPLLLLA